MRHRLGFRKLSRTSSHRRALFRNLVTSLIEHGRIETTVHKAKELRRIADKMITLGKQGDLAARRRAAAYVMTDSAVQKLFGDLGKRFAARNGGYTRIIRTGSRPGDQAETALIEYLAD